MDIQRGGLISKASVGMVRQQVFQMGISPGQGMTSPDVYVTTGQAAGIYPAGRGDGLRLSREPSSFRWETVGHPPSSPWTLC